MPPLVSCIMPTCHGPEFEEQAYKCFLRQTYAQKELVIVKSVIPLHGEEISSPFVLYEYVPAGLAIGELRNIAIRRSRGSVIAHWDDDDWSHPNRLEFQVNELKNHEACGASQAYYHDIQKEKAWIFDSAKYQGKQPSPGLTSYYKVGGTLCYLRKLWERQNFDTNRLTGEDAVWQWLTCPKWGHDLPLGYYVAKRHNNNTSQIDTTQPQFSEVDEDVVIKAMVMK